MAEKSNPQADIERFRKALASSLERLRSPDKMLEYGKLALEIMVRRTRLGYGVDNGQRTKLPPFSPGYLQYRKSLITAKKAERARASEDRRHDRFIGARERARDAGKKFNRSFNTNSKSARIIAKFKAAKVIPDPQFFSPTRPNNTLTGRLLKSFEVLGSGEGKAFVEPTGTNRNGIPNEDIATYLREKGRGFTGLTKEEEKQIQVQFERDLKNSLRGLLTNK